MALYSIGDQARAFAMQNTTSRIKNTLDVLTNELSSGEVADLGQRLGGNTRSINQIEARLQAISRLNQNSSEAASLTRGMQDVLTQIHSDGSALAVSLLTEPPLPSPAMLATRSAGIEDMLGQVISRLNHEVAGQYLFSGLNTQTPPVAGADTILSALTSATSGLTTAADVVQAVNSWFDAPAGGGGFLDTAYAGTLGTSRELAIGENRSIDLATTAGTSAIRNVLKGMAMAALVSRGVLAGQYDQQLKLMSSGAQVLLDNETGLVAEMARVGLAQQRTDEAQAENASSISILTISRNEIRRADPYETSVALTEAQSRLDSLFAVTARLSNLKLVEYLR